MAAENSNLGSLVENKFRMQVFISRVAFNIKCAIVSHDEEKKYVHGANHHTNYS